jgi:hypothetical protein
MRSSDARPVLASAKARLRLRSGARRGVVTALLLALAAGPAAGCSGGSAAARATGSGDPSGSASAQPSAVAHLAAQPAPSQSPSAVPTAAGACPIFPADNVWHADVSRLPVLGNSATLVAGIGTGAAVHADFGSGTWDGGPIGIPVTTVPAGQPAVPVTFQYRSESDPGPYPVPANAAVEGGPASTGDRHVIVLDPAHCRDYELFAAKPSGGGWQAGSGAVFDLRGNALRPAGWTSADAAGLPILAGLVRYDEVAAGHVDHAIRVTVPRSRNSYLWPARHAASSSSDAALPPMGLRLRLKASVNLSGLPAQARVVARAMQQYGVIVADNGSPWYISGAPDQRWSNDALHALGGLHGSDFEAVDTAGLMVNPGSAQVR